MARNRVPAKPSPVRTPSPTHWTSPQTRCSPSVREQTRMLFIIRRSLFVPSHEYCCKHFSLFRFFSFGEEGMGLRQWNMHDQMRPHSCRRTIAWQEVEHCVPCSSRSWFERRLPPGRQTRSPPLYTPRDPPGSAWRSLLPRCFPSTGWWRKKCCCLWNGWMERTTVSKIGSVYSRFVQGQKQILKFIMGKGKVVCLYRCDL